MKREQEGVLFCLVSAVGFGAMGIFAKFAYDVDVTVITLLAVRFGLAAIVFWLIVSTQWPGWPSRPTIAKSLLVGLVIYSAQSELLFSGLTRLDASLASLLSYVYPALVTLAAILIGREQLVMRRIVALVIASAGVSLVLWGGGPGSKMSAIGVAFVLGGAVVYTAYILLSDTLMHDIQPLMLATLVSTGAAAYFISRGLATGELRFNFGLAGWWPLIGLSLVSTVLAITLFFAGINRVGPTAASIISTVEPPTTVTLAFLLLGERLSLTQVVGGAMVLSAVIILQLRRRVAKAQPPADVAIGQV